MNTWTEKYVNLVANTPLELNFRNGINTLIVRNPHTTEVIRIDLKSEISGSNYEATATFDGWGFLIRPFAFLKAYLFASVDISNVRIYEVMTGNPLFLLQNMAQAPTGAVSVTATVGLKSTDLNLDSAKDLQVDVKTLPALPAGANNIGDVDVVSLPALPAGTNNIGDVDVVSLPALPAGTNNIGDVDVVSLPSLPAGTNNIGGVDVDSIATGEVVKPGSAPTIYNVTMTNADTEYSQALPANTKKFIVSMRENDAAYRLAFATGKVATPTAPYLLIPIGGSYSEDGLLTSVTIYFACSTAGKVIQIIAWA